MSNPAVTQEELEARRKSMVEHQLAKRGIRDRAVLRAAAHVPRDRFVPADLVEFAYIDSPLPIEASQTISQPYIVALMAELLALEPSDRILEIGTGSGYAAAVLAEIAAEVYTVERHDVLARTARERLHQLGYDNVHVRHGDGTEGWPEAAPFDAIIVAAGGETIPQPLRDQLAIGGTLVIPVGQTPRAQSLMRITRTGEETYREEDLGGVRFVPLVRGLGEMPEQATIATQDEGIAGTLTLPQRIARAAEPFSSIADASLDRLLQRIGDAQVVCLGEASHGTDEFYAMRARLTQALIREKGFNIVAVEADWPDAASIDRAVRGTDVSVPESASPFARFPTWMWANTQVQAFVRWLRQHNELMRDPEQQTGFYGLDLYSLYTSAEAVLTYLDDVDPEAAAIARQRYGCLTPWEQDPASYGAAAISGEYEACEEDVLAMLNDLLDHRLRYTAQDGQRFIDAVQNARLVANAEQYYRIMYYGSAASWNVRDQHMFDTLQLIMNYRGPESRAVVWAHNSHLGDARFTEMGRARGEHNVGQLVREHYTNAAYLVGFGTDRGTVAAASEWGGEMEVKQVRPSHERSYERLCHRSGVPNFLLPLRDADLPLRDELAEERLERAIGVIYRPETELQSHYFYAELPSQFDEYIWMDKTSAVTPLVLSPHEAAPDTFPFGV